jgi:hypothetical protein
LKSSRSSKRKLTSTRNGKRPRRAPSRTPLRFALLRNRRKSSRILSGSTNRAVMSTR